MMVETLHFLLEEKLVLVVAVVKMQVDDQEIHLQLVPLKVILEELVKPQLSLNLDLEAVVQRAGNLHV